MQFANNFKISILLLAAMLMTLGAVNAYAEDMPEPQALVKKASDDMLMAHQKRA